MQADSPWLLCLASVCFALKRKLPSCATVVTLASRIMSLTMIALQERLAAQREEVRRRAAEIDDALAELDERRREAEHRETLLAAEDERLADALSQARSARVRVGRVCFRVWPGSG